MTYQTAETVRMPLTPQRFDNHIRNRLAALPALRTIAVRVAITAPSVAILLDKRRARIERVAALCTEEVASMPLRATSDDDLALNGRLARFATRTEELVEVERAVKPQRRLPVAFFSFVQHIHAEVLRDAAGLAGCDSLETLRTFGFRLGVKRDVLEVRVTLVAVETGRMEALACC